MAAVILERILHDLPNLDLGELRVVEQAIHAQRSSEYANDSRPTPAEIEAANALLWETIVTLPTPTGEDNEQIDADLGREYGDDHASLHSMD